MRREGYMERRIFMMIAVAIVGILVGVGVVSKQSKDPLLRQIIENQNQMISWQNQQGRSGVPGQNFQAGNNNQVAAIMQTQQNLENRIVAIETQLKVFQQALAGAGNAPKNPPQPPPEDLTTVYEIPVDHSPVKGNKNARVTIVEFMDFQCPFCARFHPPVEEVLKAYPKDVNLIIKNFPLGFHP